jgi:Cft2 family RNA processing exonuclease
LANQWFLVDAGVRVDHSADPLPDLALLEGKDIRAIFVTHAHADHIGALPLVHRAFPTVPIYASRATGLLMQVMLVDALKIMNKRAQEEMELPLYQAPLVESMLNQVRPLPVGEPCTFPELPGIQVQASRAGHIAGAVSLGFTAAGGSIVVSGDVSITPQRTVLGAVPPPVERCDLLVLESTYGSRLHPNRQAEELRLAQAVAAGLKRGGHVLIPCFGLGRGQEILLLLQAAQQKGQIPVFPIYVDGLVRRVCSTYQMLPEALTPTLQRQIHRGYTPFTGTSVTFVRNEQERERILLGAPACILSSSGMLTGGPSVWYAARLASQPAASIFITGYQDEESPGRKLLDLAEHKNSTIELQGQQIAVQCQVAKYSLSAHADGSELAGYAAALHPKRIALVHGDEEARRSLRDLLTNTEVLLPRNGETLDIAIRPRRTKSTISAQHEPATVSVGDAGNGENVAQLMPPLGTGESVFFDASHLEFLWQTMLRYPDYSVVTARELARVWYGDALIPEHTQWLLDVLENEQPYDFQFFVRLPGLQETFRVHRPHRNTLEESVRDLVGQLVLMRTTPGAAKPALCRSIEPGESLRVQFPKHEVGERTRYPLRAVLDVIGPLFEEISGESDIITDFEAMKRVVSVGRRKRRVLSAHGLAEALRENEHYTLSDLCELAGVSPRSLDERLAVAKLVQKHPRLFMESDTFLENDGQVLYTLAPTWQEALREPELRERPDQNWILGVIEQHIGTPQDLYKRSIDPDTGDVTLAFHFPRIAVQRYEAALEEAADETGVTITIAPNAHHGALTNVMHRLLPKGLRTCSTPSLYYDRETLGVEGVGDATQEEIVQAEQTFFETTGWHLQLSVTAPTQSKKPVSTSAPVVAAATILPSTSMSPASIAASNSLPETTSLSLRERGMRVDQQSAMYVAKRALKDLPDLYKVGADANNGALILRFYFPEVARSRYVQQFTLIEEQTGWDVRVSEGIHQGALIDMAYRLLPSGLNALNTPSIHQRESRTSVRCTGEASREEIAAAQQAFVEKTGWILDIVRA